MKELAINTKMMTSLEFAEMTGSQHKDVLHSIRELLNEGRNTQVFILETTYKGEQGKKLPMYNLGFKACMLLAGKYQGGKYTSMIVDSILARVQKQYQVQLELALKEKPRRINDTRSPLRSEGDLLTATYLLKEAGSGITPMEFFSALDALGITEPVYPRVLNHRLIDLDYGQNEPKGPRNQVVFLSGKFDELLDQVQEFLIAFED